MDNININLTGSSENLINIIDCVNNIKSEINAITKKINMINVDGTWDCNSSEKIKNIFVEKLSFYLNECEDIDSLIKKLINNLENYTQVDEQIIKKMNGTV